MADDGGGGGRSAICPVCREPAAATDRLCEVCGAELLGPPDPIVDRVEIDLGPLAGVSDRGHVHVRNEDAMALGRRPEEGPARTLAAVVCDGVSTVRRPELASRAATAAALDTLLGGTASGVPLMLAAVASAADAVAQLAPGTPDAPSCTLVAALVSGLADGRPVITVGWVGDSRAYWLSEGGRATRLLTADHSWAAEMVGAGILDAATAMRDPRAHGITRWLGADRAPVPGVTTLSPEEPGTLLLCTDGLWNYLPDAARLATAALPLITREGPSAAANVLAQLALDAGGRDNITVVCIRVRPISANPDPAGSTP
jgi:serine/threonine protein phosphatase PrpC